MSCKSAATLTLISLMHTRRRRRRDLPMEKDGGFDVEITQMSSKKKGAVSRNWIVLDRSGGGVVMDLDKYDIMRRVPINARDLRILDPLLSYPSAILGREKAIVLNLEHIKAIITTNEVLLRDPLDDNVMPVVEEFQRRLPMAIEGEDEELPESRSSIVGTDEETDFPFEFRALEVALEAICSSLDAQTRELEVAAYPALDELTAKTSSRNLDRVRKMKSAMTRLTSRVQKVRDELEQLLDDDDDMADLYLSRKATMSDLGSSDYEHTKWQLAADDESLYISSKTSQTSSRTTALTSSQEEDSVEKLEMLLEAYFVQIESTMNKLTTLREYIDDTEDYINIQLDNHRNQLIQLELFLSSGTVCLSVYSFVAAVFGMNIPYPWRKDHGYLFKWVVMLTALACGSLFLSIISYAKHKGLVGS
ncbi:magnesium transporter MRS2-I-like isoform X2 [Andrographis paniculata]|uniref:magnesium transporter MRS2-I-like isoform X2 n=1 Tax=Andrographis paniculata TaxID=175694 RepID=UPI0021E8D5B9|nr:magnesium transporter MRS2-I-like isoform X2 [Andrographis paniculata]